MIGQQILEDGLRTVGRFRLTVLARATPPRIAASVLAAAFLFLTGPASAQESELALQLQRVRRDLSDLQAYVYSGKAPSREAIAKVEAGSSDSTARLQVQLQDLESQVRTLTGRIEEIEYGLNRVTERVEKLVADIDVRFRELEGGGKAGGPAGGTTQGNDGKRSEAAPPVTAGTQVASTAEQPLTSPPTKPTAKGLDVGQQVLGTMSQSGDAELVKPPLKSLPEGADGKTAAAGEKVASAAATPRERYDAAFAYLQKRDYDKAAGAFDQFVKENPESPLSSNALYWLGETHYYRKDYAEAARVFLDGYKRYPKGNKAPDNLYKLGKSLAGVNEKQPACAAWNKLLKSYPTANKRLLGNAKSEMSKLGCS
jgi:tol-pal system protein YbgF